MNLGWLRCSAAVAPDDPHRDGTDASQSCYIVANKEVPSCTRYSRHGCRSSDQRHPGSRGECPRLRADRSRPHPRSRNGDQEGHRAAGGHHRRIVTDDRRRRSSRGCCGEPALTVAEGWVRRALRSPFSTPSTPRASCSSCSCSWFACSFSPTARTRACGRDGRNWECWRVSVGAGPHSSDSCSVSLPWSVSPRG